VKRLFDIFFSSIGIIMLLPLFVVLGIMVLFSGKGGIFYRQIRIGRYGKEFKMIKFRSMKPESDKKGLLTVGRDSRITKTGEFLRKYKLDELPQLFNVFAGNMSLVGPRPEVKKYVDLYTEDQKKILNVKPGITDYASIEYRNENEILSQSDNPEQTYINEIMPAKINLNYRYLNNPGIIQDIKIILMTIKHIIFG
jgi:lipopolysaccharide/colanic/teichoic acid biosynthesis glycosyltransferase